jgi:hypothetical protein
MLCCCDTVLRLIVVRRPFTLAPIVILISAYLSFPASPAFAQEVPVRPAGGEPAKAVQQPAAPTAPEAKPKKSQAELEAELSKLLSGATLEGSFTTTGPGRDGQRLSADRYTLGEVRKLSGNIWLIQARMREAMIPLPLPIEWAGDTPLIIVDNFTIPGMGTFSARVMFFADHYAGYWKHDERGGSMFGVIHRAKPDAAPTATPPGEQTPAPPARPPSPNDKSKQ